MVEHVVGRKALGGEQLVRLQHAHADVDHHVLADLDKLRARRWEQMAVVGFIAEYVHEPHAAPGVIPLVIGD
ncbi:hypothetical protein D3C76_1761230 [compost metagenome]